MDDDEDKLMAMMISHSLEYDMNTCTKYSTFTEKRTKNNNRAK